MVVAPPEFTRSNEGMPPRGDKELLPPVIFPTGACCESDESGAIVGAKFWVRATEGFAKAGTEGIEEVLIGAGTQPKELPLADTLAELDGNQTPAAAQTSGTIPGTQELLGAGLTCAALPGNQDASWPSEPSCTGGTQERLPPSPPELRPDRIDASARRGGDDDMAVWRASAAAISSVL